MPPRKKAKTHPQKHELEAFAEKYDTLADIFGDPVETVFQIMADTTDEEVALRAAEMLMSYRYPRVKASEGDQSRAPPLTFNVLMPQLAVASQKELGVESGYAAARTLPAADKSTNGSADE